MRGRVPRSAPSEGVGHRMLPFPGRCHRHWLVQRGLHFGEEFWIRQRAELAARRKDAALRIEQDQAARMVVVPGTKE